MNERRQNNDLDLTNVSFWIPGRFEDIATELGFVPDERTLNALEEFVDKFFPPRVTLWLSTLAQKFLKEYTPPLERLED